MTSRSHGGGGGGGGRRRRLPSTRLRPVLGSRPCARAVVCLVGLLLGRTGVLVEVSADDLEADDFTPRSYDGVGNNEAFTDWGAVGTTLVRLQTGPPFTIFTVLSGRQPRCDRRKGVDEHGK